MEYCETDLEKLIQKQNCQLQFDIIENYMKQIIKGVDCLHINNLAHRDLKPNNILIKIKVNGEHFLKIGDFGTIKKQQKFVKDQNNEISFEGSKLFWPEEIDQFSNKIDYYKQDIFSLGITFLILCGYPLITQNDIEKVKNENNYNFQQLIQQKCTGVQQDIQQLIMKMLDRSQKRRPYIQYVRRYLQQRQESYSTNIITGNNYNENNQKQLKNGFYEHKYQNGDVYKGDWVNNNKEGEGKFIYIKDSIYEAKGVKNSQCYVKKQQFQQEQQQDIYEGYFFNNQRDGKGIYKWKNGDIYQGMWVKGKIEGFGKFVWQNGDYYEGYFQNNKMQGQGKFVWVCGNEYEGEFENNRKQGQGIMKWENGNIYKGEFTDDKQEGYGKLYWKNGVIYKGQFKDNKRTEDGVYIWKNGDIYNGDLFQGKKHGNGHLRQINDQIYKGQFKHNKKSGKGDLKFQNGDEYSGQFYNNKMNGKGTYIWANGDVYEGQFQNNQKQGYGVMMYKRGDILYYKGQYYKDKKQGDGEQKWANGTIYKGTWKKDQFTGQMNDQSRYVYKDYKKSINQCQHKYDNKASHLSFKNEKCQNQKPLNKKKKDTKKQNKWGANSQLQIQHTKSTNNINNERSYYYDQYDNYYYYKNNNSYYNGEIKKHDDDKQNSVFWSCFKYAAIATVAYYFYKNK